MGLEANPFAAFASRVKLNWEPDPDALQQEAHTTARAATKMLRDQGIDDSRPFAALPADIALRALDAEANSLLLAGSISPLPLHKSLVLLECLQRHATQTCYPHLLLALVNALVHRISNLHFGPEVGAGTPKSDVPVISCWLRKSHAWSTTCVWFQARRFRRQPS